MGRRLTIYEADNGELKIDHGEDDVWVIGALETCHRALIVERLAGAKRTENPSLTFPPKPTEGAEGKGDR